MSTVAVSVVVPLAPGEAEWPVLVADLKAALPQGFEVLLTAADAVAVSAVAGHLKVRVVVCDGGRARQLNAGAREAKGSWLWFLHADSRLSAETVPTLLAFVADGRDALGWFDLAFRPGGPPLMRLNAWGANLRSSWLGMPFGDQGLVLPSHCFATLGGYDETAPYGEDHLLVWAARRAGLPLKRVGARLLTSARKYERDGWAATTARHLRLTAAQALPEWRRLHEAAP